MWKRWKMPRELAGILAVAIVVLLYQAYLHIVLVVLIIMGLLICLFSFVLYNLWWLKDNSSIVLQVIFFILIMLLLIPFIRVSSNISYYETEFQKWISNGMQSIGKSIIMLRRPWRYIQKEAKRDMRDNISESGSLSE